MPLPESIDPYLIDPYLIDAGAEALRLHEQGRIKLKSWSSLPNSRKAPWRQKARVVIAAERAAQQALALQAWRNRISPLDRV